MGNIGSKGRGEGHAGRGERPQGPKEGRGRRAVEGGRDREEPGWPRREAEMGGKKTATRRTTTAEKSCGSRGHDHNQVSSNGDGGEHREIRDGQEGSNETSDGLSGESADDLA